MRDDVESIVNLLLSEAGDDILRGEERQEVLLSRNIIDSTRRLQEMMPNPNAEVIRLLAAIRAGANQIIQLHSLGTKADRLPTP